MAKLEFGSNIRDGVFVKRISRFSALVRLNGEDETVYLPNSGRMKELLLPDAKVLVIDRRGDTRKTKFDLIGVYFQNQLISIDSRVPNLLLGAAFADRSLTPFWELVSYQKEVTVGNSKLDFLLHMPDRLCYVEAKSVTLVERGVARFPDAPTDRGSKHLLELIDLVSKGYRGAVIFIIQRSDAQRFEPNSKTDLKFAESLLNAKAAGVELYAYNCLVNEGEIVINREVPVCLEG